MRKETLHKYKNMGWKSNLKLWIPVTLIDQEVSRRCWALNFDKYSYREAIEELLRRQELSRSIHLAIERCRALTSIDQEVSSSCQAICPQLSSYLSSFSEQLFFTCFLVQSSWL